MEANRVNQASADLRQAATLPVYQTGLNTRLRHRHNFSPYITNAFFQGMFDISMVQYLANEMRFYELVIFLEEHRSEYVRFILTGEA